MMGEPVSMPAPGVSAGLRVRFRTYGLTILDQHRNEDGNLHHSTPENNPRNLTSEPPLLFFSPTPTSLPRRRLSYERICLLMRQYRRHRRLRVVLLPSPTHGDPVLIIAPIIMSRTRPAVGMCGRESGRWI